MNLTFSPDGVTKEFLVILHSKEPTVLLEGAALQHMKDSLMEKGPEILGAQKLRGELHPRDIKNSIGRFAGREWFIAQPD